MLEFDEAQSRLADAGQPPTTSEIVPLHQAHGRILAQTLFAVLDNPPADNSAMDGYAIRHADAVESAILPVQQRSYAGDPAAQLQRGKAIRLFTGSLIPEGADTVIMQEDTVESDGLLTINHLPPQGSHIRHQGEDISKDNQLLAKGALLNAAAIAMLASQGYAEVSVYKRLRVGILTTGDELVSPGQPIGPGQIYNSNGPMLAGLVQGLGADASQVLHAEDTQESLHTAFETLMQECDLILTVGGVSVGEKDLVKPTLEAMGGEMDLWRVRMKPGKPVALAHIQDKPVVCLPGNPVSAFVVFTLLATPLIRNMQGRAQVYPPVQSGRLKAHREYRETREEFLRVQAHAEGERLDLQPYTEQGSGFISSLPWASGLARVPAGTTVSNGDTLAYYDFAHWLA